MRTSKSLTDIVQEWIDGYDISPVSRADYKKKINLWFRYLSLMGEDPRSPGRKDIVEYKSWLYDNKKSVYTVNSYVTVVKLFYKWCDQRHYWGNIGEGIKSSTTSKYYNKTPLSIEQAEQLIASIDRDDPYGARDLLIITLMLFNGLRTCEVNRINIEDFDKKENVPILWIQRKGRHEKTESVVLHPDTVELFEEVISTRDFSPSDPLFITLRPQDRFKVCRLSKHSIASIVKKRLKKIGIDDPKISAHSLRHTFGCMMIEEGVELDTVKELMGHSNSSTTRIYVELARQRKLLHQSPIIKIGNILLNKC